MIVNSLTPAEEQLMQVLWSLDKPYLRDIMQALPEPRSHQNTVSTYLKILTDKDYLKPEREGRIFRYQVLIDKQTYAKVKLKRLIDDFYSGSPESLLEHLERSGPVALSQALEGIAESSASKSASFHDPKKKKEPGKKYKTQLAAFVTGLDKVNKKEKKSAKKKKKAAKESPKSKDKPSLKPKESKSKTPAKTKEKPNKN